MISFLQTLKNLLKNPSSKKIEFTLMDKAKIEHTTESFWLPPTQAMKQMPSWYKKMATYNQGLINQPTVKKCPPILEMYRHGYIIPNSVDITIKQVIGEKGFDSFLYEYPQNYAGENLISGHSRQQVHAVPLIDKWKSHAANKYNNPWLIKTPPGYSTLFLNPLINDVPDTYYAFEAIVDTDNWHEVNFPFVVNWNKISPGGEYVFKRGDPIVLAIPFKRSDFHLEVTYNNKKLNKIHKRHAVEKGMNFSNFYKNLSKRIKF